MNKDNAQTQSHNFLSPNISQPQSQASKNNKHHRSCQRDYLTTGVNASEIAKKDRDKAKNLSHIKYYTSKQKGLDTNKCLDKAKN